MPIVDVELVTRPDGAIAAGLAQSLAKVVTVLKRSIPAGTELEAEVSALTNVIATAVGRASSCVHIEYAPAGNGRLSFGGKLVE